MRLSQLFTKTRKEAPAEETSRNAQLLIRAGYIHKEMAGVYAFLPLGLRVLENIKQIVREEMNAVGGQELMMTALQPRELWEKTDRWDDTKVDNWFKTKLANGAELGVGLTHEEPIVDVVGQYVTSYKDLPLSVYQIQSKFRNELRAKSGLLRGREFMMKDMYSFCRTQQEHEELYEKIADAYMRVYDRLGLGDITFRTKADGGIFTERYSDEYQTLSGIGEDTIFNVPDTDNWFNQEVAPAIAPSFVIDEQLSPMEEVEGKGIIGVEALAEYLRIPVAKTTKTMLYQTDDGRVIAVAVRGGYEVNEIKLRKVVDAKMVKLADETTVRRVTGAEIGYAGIINLPDDVTVIVDESCANRINFEMGANRTNFHSINVNWGRDLPLPDRFYDIKVAKEGDFHPDTKMQYQVHKGVEVGNIFPLESKYTDALDVYYTDENGDQQSIIMGCYGIGISRLMGILVEHFSDEKGIVWPENVAPFTVYIARLHSSEAVVEAADSIYNQLQKAGVGVLYDDREMRPGEKFADADLLGIPYRLVISEKTVESGKHELKRRTDAESKLVSADELMNVLVGGDTN